MPVRSYLGFVVATLIATSASLATAAPVAESEPNDTFGTAQNVDGSFSIGADADIIDSTTVPHVTVTATGDDTIDFFSFTANRGDRITLDIDYSTGGLDSFIKLYNPGGSLLTSNDDVPITFGAGGSVTSLDSGLRRVAGSSGVHAVSVEGLGAGGVVPTGKDYVLQISVGPTPHLLDNGQLLVAINETTGALDVVHFGGSDFFNPLEPVSDFGFQVGTNDATFRVNTTNDEAGVPVTVTGTGTAVTVTGNYAPSGLADVDFERVISLVPGQNVIKITTTLTNNDASEVNLRYFDTLDPDQGVEPGLNPQTFNDAFDLLGTLVGQASSSSDGTSTGTPILTVLAGSTDLYTVAAGAPFDITDGIELNDFFANPSDANGAFVDLGLHVGVDLILGAGQSAVFTFYLAFGETPAEAQAAYVAALTPTPVPAPTSLATLTLATLAIGARRARRSA